MKKLYLLPVFLFLSIIVSYAQPPVGAPAPPARTASDVVSLFSAAYTNVGGTDWFPNWGQSTTVTDVYIGTDTLKSYTNLNYQGVQFSGSVNASSMTNLHVDIWTPNCTAFDVFLINTSPSTKEQPYTIVPTLSGWNSVDIPLSAYNNIALNNIGQIKLVGTPFGSSTVYLDNFYFWKSSSTPTLSGFAVPAKMVGDAAFNLTAPTSNSPGAFSYTSSNLDVATISGTTVTIVGAGTSIITANQAAAGGFTAGTTTATLVVTFPPPATGPSAPTKLADHVISLFSDVYSNVPADWFPNWGQSTVVTGYKAGTDSMKKYEYLNYQGIQLGATLDVSKAKFLHFDIWTPNATAFEVSLIKTDPAPTVEQPFTVNPTKSGWNSFDIPLSAYDKVPLDKIGQIKLVGTPFGTSTVYLDNVFFWSDISLPVKLVSFSAIKNGNNAVLNWKTATEQDNSGFTIERSANAANWIDLNFVKGINGQGNSYQFTDQSPLKGINYYRLKQTDVNGNRSFSAVQSVSFEVAGKPFSVSPNPAKGFITISTSRIESANATLSLLDMSGHQLKKIRLSAQNAGSNVSINIGLLPAGIYNLVLSDGVKISTERLVIN